MKKFILATIAFIVSVTLFAQDIAQKVNDKDVARVSNYSGVLVFTDCMPIAPYEILGEVNSVPSSNSGSSMMMSAGGMFFMGNITTPQYTDIRDQLITNAVLANRQVEGIIISLPKEGEGRATLIKFKDDSDDNNLAKVITHQGVMVFMDCMPINSYTFVGKINKAGGMSADYSAIRDRLIKKSKKKFPDMQAIIPRLVSGGHDSAEAIKF